MYQFLKINISMVYYHKLTILMNNFQNWKMTFAKNTHSKIWYFYAKSIKFIGNILLIMENLSILKVILSKLNYSFISTKSQIVILLTNNSKIIWNNVISKLN